MLKFQKWISQDNCWQSFCLWKNHQNNVGYFMDFDSKYKFGPYSLGKISHGLVFSQIWEKLWDNYVYKVKFMEKQEYLFQILEGWLFFNSSNCMDACRRPETRLLGQRQGRFITHSSSQSSSICDVHSSYRVLPIGPDAVYTCGGVHYHGEL